MHKAIPLGIAATAVCVAIAAYVGRSADPPGNVPVAAQAPNTLGSAAPAPDRAPEQPVRDTSRAPIASASATSRVTLVGSVQPADQATLSVTQAPARVLAVRVAAGDNVRRGQTLIDLDVRQYTAQERTAQAGVQAADAQVRKAQIGKDAQRMKLDADVHNAEIGMRQAQSHLRQATLARDAARAEAGLDLRQAQENLDKAELALKHARETRLSLEPLAKVGGVARNDLEAAREQEQAAQADRDAAADNVRKAQAGPTAGTAYRVALAQQDVATAQAGVSQALEGLTSAREARVHALELADADIQSAKAARAQAQAGVEAARGMVFASELRSPLDGLVTSVAIHPGETAQPGMSLVTVVSRVGLRVEALATARQFPALHAGQAALIRTDTRPGRPYRATLSEVSRVAEPDGRTFRVRFTLSPAAAAVLRPGQTAYVTVLSTGAG